VVEKGGERKAPCKLVRVTPRGGGNSLVVFEVEALWVDDALAVQVQLAPH
jgi:hypothetical protein